MFEKKTKIRILVVAIVLIIVVIVASLHFGCRETSGIVTDKWTKAKGFGRTIFVLEIDEEFTESVTDFEYHNIEIGDKYFYMKWWG